MVTRIFHCDRDREQAVVLKEDVALPTGWTRIRQEGPEGGYSWVFCVRCSAYLRELLATLGLAL